MLKLKQQPMNVKSDQVRTFLKGQRQLVQKGEEGQSSYV
ncbi:hypothetical protein SMIM3I_00400 [Streptococcus mitis]|uniref:Uncharacterized protein n=1 Tax=Streptococcus mitis TaxID=28037 RepID=A0A150NWA9_STRMT|nr:hypothetical protein SMIM3I_00400 [Streptococcus mitis]